MPFSKCCFFSYGFCPPPPHVTAPFNFNHNKATDVKKKRKNQTLGTKRKHCSFPPLQYHSGHVTAIEILFVLHILRWEMGGLSVPGFCGDQWMYDPAGLNHRLRTWLVLSGKQTPPTFGWGKPLYSKLWKCISFHLEYCKARRPKNALKRALFPFRTVSKLILLPYKATDFAINDRYFINRDEFSTRAHKNSERDGEFVCLPRRLLWTLYPDLLVWSRFIFVPVCVAGCTPVSL